VDETSFVADEVAVGVALSSWVIDIDGLPLRVFEALISDVGDSVTLPVPLCVALRLREADGSTEAVELRLSSSVLDSVAEGERLVDLDVEMLVLGLNVTLRDSVTLPVAVKDVDNETSLVADRVSVPLPLTEAERVNSEVGLSLVLGLVLAVCDAESVEEDETSLVEEMVADPLELSDPENDNSSVIDVVGELLHERSSVADDEGLGDRLAVGVVVAVGERLMLGLWVRVSVGESVPVGVDVAVGESDRVVVRDALDDPEADADGDALIFRVGVAVTLGDAL
jgi:hypothetical protein